MKFSNQFRGVRIDLASIALGPDAPPLKRKNSRRIIEKRIGHLRGHVRSLEAQRVLKELEGSSGTHLSPVHVDNEWLFIASERRGVEESHMVLGQRGLDASFPDVSFPLLLVSFPLVVGTKQCLWAFRRGRKRCRKSVSTAE